MAEAKNGCVKPAKGVIGVKETKSAALEAPREKEALTMVARVSKPAPDFEVSAFVGSSFKNIKLSDYKGKWVVLCFYPGDFTFV
jgi:peroxiredoxin (alkyl hydroperoxide reductase subunit C)